MSDTTKRIPVTEERWKQLNELKETEDTYDDLLGKLTQGHRRHRLAERAKEVRVANCDDLASLD